jgi:hypothetical protein
MMRRFWLGLAIGMLCAAPARADDVNVSPTFVDFGRVKLGTTATVRVTFTNLTASELQVSGGGGLSAPFSANVGTCNGGIVPASSSCYFNYSFRPNDNSGAIAEDETSVGISGGASPENVPLRFRGRGMGNLVDVAFADVDFGDWFVGEQASVRLRLVNTHTAGVLLSGGGFNTSNGFSAFGCGIGGNPLPSGDACDFQYFFQPPATGFRENSTSIGVSTSDSPSIYQVFPLHFQGMGIATVPLVGVSPVEVDFGDVTIGRRVEVPVSYTSFDPAEINTSGGGFNDNDDAFFAVGSGEDGCSGGALPSGETCAINYSFRPGEQRDFAASTSIGFSRPPDYEVEPLSFAGTGIGTLAQVSPVQIVYGDVATGTNVTVPVVITNTSEAPLTNFVGGGVLSPFSLTSNTCGTSLAVGASCQFNYRFTSSSATPASTQTLLSFTNASGIQPTHQISLYANGAPEPGALALGLGAFGGLALARRQSESGVAKRRR